MSVTNRLYEIFLPRGGAVMALVEVYFDESSSRPISGVAGYLFEKDACRKLEGEWGEVLVEWGLSSFHMVDCAHGNGEFGRISKPDRVEIQTKLIGILKRYMACGFVASIDLRYCALLPTVPSWGMKLISPYSMCCYFGLMHARRWAESSGFEGEIAYFFEAGDSHQTEANRMMGELFSSPTLRNFYRYAAHSFVPAEKAVPLQCADLLAWQWTKAMKDKVTMGKEKFRADLMSLLEVEHFAIHLNENTIHELRKSVAEANKQIEALGMAESAKATFFPTSDEKSPEGP